MKNSLLLAAAGAAALLLAGCAGDGGPVSHMAMDSGHHDDAGVDIFYDGAYGPVVNGYWGADGSFYYHDSADHPFQRDTDMHFAKSRATGYKLLHLYRDGVH